MIASSQSSGKSIARTSLAFYIRDELRPVIANSSSCFLFWSHACRSGRDAGLAGSIGALVRVLLHRGETTWQQRRNVVVKPRLRRPHAVGVRRPAALRRAKVRARVREKRRPVPRHARSGASARRGKVSGKAGELAGFFAFSGITSSNARSPAARFSRSARDTPSHPSVPRARTRCSLPGSSWGWPRSRRSLPWL
jgi:hypothetical protein